MHGIALENLFMRFINLVYEPAEGKMLCREDHSYEWRQAGVKSNGVYEDSSARFSTVSARCAVGVSVVIDT